MLGNRALLSILLLISIPVFHARAQESLDSLTTRDSPSIFRWAETNWVRPDATRTERLGYVLGASAVFSFADYVGFNLLKRSYIHSGGDPPAFRPPVWFRFAEAALQTGMSYVLYDRLGLSSAITFNLMWWTWCDDFGYYGWGYATGLFPWESARESGLRFTEYTSAGWTPIGLLRRHGAPVAKSTLLAQSAGGLTISMAILW